MRRQVLAACPRHGAAHADTDSPRPDRAIVIGRDVPSREVWPTCGHSRWSSLCDGPTMQGSSISGVHFEQSAHQGSAGCVSACQRGFVVRGGVEPPTCRFSGGRSYRLSYLTLARCSAWAPTAAVLTGFEPATSTLTGWRALRLLYRTLLCRGFRSSLARAYHRRRCGCRVR